MTARASITQAEIARLVRGARAAGFDVGAIRLPNGVTLIRADRVESGDNAKDAIKWPLDGAADVRL